MPFSDIITDTVNTTTQLAISPAGATQGTATAITSQVTTILSGSANTGVILPSPTTGDYKPYYILNRTGNNIKLYPPSGSSFLSDVLGGSTNTAFVMTPNYDQWWVCIPYSSTIWSVGVLAPSGSRTTGNTYFATPISVTGGTSTISVLLQKRLLEENTAVAASPNVIVNTESGTVFTNQGAAALNVHTLPTASAGQVYHFCVKDADGIKVNTSAAGQTIRYAATVSASGGYIQSTTIGDCFTLTGLSTTEWYVTAAVGAGIAVT